MKKVIGILKLIRWVNLLIIALSMYFFQYCVIKLYLSAANIIPTMSWGYFSLLVLSTVLIAAAGNVSNAYFDYEQDMEYKPGTVVIGTHISLDNAFAMQMGLNIAGVMLGFFLAYHYGNVRLGYVFLSVAALLWIYSQILKKLFLVGNLIIAILSAFVFVMPVLFEAQLTQLSISDNLDMARTTIIAELQCYFVFAFLISLIREIVKDAEDRDADAAYTMHTLPVVLPTRAVNSIVTLLLIAVMIGLAYLQKYFWLHDLKRHFWYIMFVLQFQILVIIITSLFAKSKKEYHNLSVLLKLLMFLGIASLPLFFWFIQLQNS